MKIIFHHTAFLLFFCGFTCAAQHKASRETNLEQLKKLYQLEAYYERFSGVIQVRDQEGLLFQESFGGIKRGISANLATRFDIGSISKSFTAAAVLTLVHKGQLNLQDPINSHLGVLASDRWGKVTIHHLLTHTSGIPSIYQTEQGLPIFFPETKPIALETLMAKFNGGRLLFKPGKSFSYSNSGYVILAALIEQVSGLAFDQFMKEQIFNKYELQNTSFVSNELTAQPYFGYRSDFKRKAPENHWSWSIGAGGIQTNIQDLSKWLKIIQSPVFLSEQLRSTYLKQQVSTGYGYGWEFSTDGKIQHDGGTSGYISFVSFDPTTNEQVIVMSNRSFEDIHRFGESANYIRKLVDKTWKVIQGESIKPLPMPGKLTIAPGVYQFSNGQQLLLKSISDSTVSIAATGVTPSRIVPASALDNGSEKAFMMNEVAQLLLQKKHWRLAKHCNGEMKFVCYSGLFGVGMNMIRKKTGPFHSVTAYYADETFGLLRIRGKKQVADLITYFDEQGKIKGLFERGYYSLDKVSSLLAYATNDGNLFLDGFNESEPDVLLKFQGDKVFLTQSGRTIEGQKVLEH